MPHFHIHIHGAMGERPAEDEVGHDPHTGQFAAGQHAKAHAFHKAAATAGKEGHHVAAALHQHAGMMHRDPNQRFPAKTQEASRRAWEASKKLGYERPAEDAGTREGAIKAARARARHGGSSLPPSHPKVRSGPTPSSFWSYKSDTPTPSSPPKEAFRGSQQQWESLSPGMRREIARQAEKSKAKTGDQPSEAPGRHFYVHNG